MQNTRLAGGRLRPSARVHCIALFLLALAVRLALLPLIHNPGVNDPVHYYNLGRRLSQGAGFTIDYVWHYAKIPPEITHPVDHWMPLPGLAAALGIAAGGESPRAAVSLFIVAGSLVPLLVYFASLQLRLPAAGAFLAGCFAALLPEFVLNSLRTDTTILNMFFLCSCLLIFNLAMERGRSRYFALGGCLLGLAYLTRNDSIVLLPLLLALLMYFRRRSYRSALKDSAILLAAFLALVTPWLLRNLAAYGMLTSPLSARMPFMVEPIELYAYGIPLDLNSLLSRQTAAELLGKRLFELAAALKQIGAALHIPLLVLTPAGLFLFVKTKDWRRLRLALPTLCWLAAILLIYPLLMPVHNQGGSFKKAFLSAAPLLIPLGVYALWQWARRPKFRMVFGGIALLWLAGASIDFVRQEADFANTYHASVGILLDALQSLPDRDGDGEIRLMTQDPYGLSYHGMKSIVTPLASREHVLELARQYHIDYLMLPAARPALDSLYLGAEADPRFRLARHLADAGAIPWELYQFEF